MNNIITDKSITPIPTFEQFSINCTIALKQVILETLKNNGAIQITDIDDELVNKIAKITSTLIYQKVEPINAYRIALQSYINSIPNIDFPHDFIGHIK